MSLNSIDTKTKNKLQSDQVILDLQSAVKELIENSLDANSSIIEINFYNSGFDGFKVIDNGFGIHESSFSSLTKKHFTSKLSNFDDLNNLCTFGFRGEALSSLSTISKSFDCLTATDVTSPKATNISFDNKGNITQLRHNIPRQRGTTISLSTLFYNLPVRRREFEKNLKREFSKAINLLQSYALCPLHSSVKFNISNYNKANKKSIIFQTAGKSSLPSSIASVFGSTANQSLVPLSLELPVQVDPSIAKREGITNTSFTVNLIGSISKPLFAHGRSTSDRQYFYINGRPCNLPKVAKSINSLFRSYINQSYPFIVADFKIPTDAYDVNITPDKRTIFLHFESSLIDSLNYHLNLFFEPFRGHFTINKQSQSVPTPIIHQPSIQMHSIPLNEPPNKLSDLPQKDADDDQHSYDRDAESLSEEQISQDDFQKKPNNNSIDSDNDGSVVCEKVNDLPENPMSSSQINTRHASWASEVFPDNQVTLDRAPKRRKTETELIDEISDRETDTKIRIDQTDSKVFDNGFYNQIDVNDVQNPHNIDMQIVNDTFTIDESSEDDEPNYFRQSLTVNIDELHYKWQKDTNKSNALTNENSQKLYSEKLEKAGIENFDNSQAAEQALSRVLHKTDFENLEILGQFNLGFMIVKRKAVNDNGLQENDLFIVDQHAADEKYNYEKLQLNSRIQSQKLIKPRTLDLSASDELTVFDNLETLKQNGFEIQVDGDGASGRRCQLVALPLSKTTVFDLRDLEELIHDINENPSQVPRCTKAKDMFASRACRMSVMVGKSLKKKQMTSIVRNLSTLKQPWNCPHGRPTLRHLLSLENKQDDWNEFYASFITVMESEQLAMFCPDPVNNPDFRIPRIKGIDHDNLPPSEQIEQMDQRITLTLQNIDADLSNVYNVILSRILPEIKNYGLATDNSRNISKYWKSFFEHAAQVRVSQTGEQSFGDTYYSDDLTATNINHGAERDDDRSINETFNQDSFLGQLANNGVSSTPLPKVDGSEANIQDRSTTIPNSLESPFERLRRQIRENDDDDINFETSNSTSILPSFSLPSASEAEAVGTGTGEIKPDDSQLADDTINYNDTNNYHENQQTSSMSFSFKHSTHEVPINKENQDNDGLEKTPKKGKVISNPFGGPNWNGITDLRNTPLRIDNKEGKFNFSSHNYRQSDEDGLDSDEDEDDVLPPGMSPPQTMNFTMPKSKLQKTPAKEAAASIVDDILRETGQSNKKPLKIKAINAGDDDNEDDQDTLMHQGSFMTRNYSKGNDFNPDVSSSSTTSSLDDTSIQPQPLALTAAAVMANIQDDSDSDDDSINNSMSNQNTDASDTLFGPRSNKNQESKLQLHGDVTSTWFGTNINNAGHDPQSPLGK
ncbi:hypothetical protein E3P78_02943 [Wallemia ichthyophaga]|nr:hypothetical protein E3P78_02943 [Wallemia ichthyophaga]